MKTLKIESQNGYLNFTDLPSNCIFNKVITGCGGTTIALFNNENYVIAVPTTELITNKTGLIEGGVATITSPAGEEQTVFGLFGTFSYALKKELKEYLATSGIKKIMCTYDKVDALTKILNPADYRLLVDEYHILLKAYSYRSKAINGVLSNFRKYSSFCFLSATPIDADFKPSILEGVEEYRADWGNNVDTLFVKLEQTNKPYLKAAHIIEAYKKDGYVTVNGDMKSTEAFFFLNSVTDIAAILKHCNLRNDEVKIVCADTEPNRKKLEGYTISNSRAASKKFTFITSKSFEGADYYSEDALCYVVSNSTNKNTLLDISTDIYQIAGRIRTATNPFRNLIIHIFNSAGQRRIEEIEYNELVDRVNKELKGTKLIVDFVNQNPEAKDGAKKSFNEEYVYTDEDGLYKVNDMVAKLELYTFRLEQSIYKNGIALRKAYEGTGATTTDIDYTRIDEAMDKAKKISFKDAFIRYAELNSNKFQLGIDSELEYLVNAQPLIVDAYNKLGTDRVRKLRYIKKDIEKALCATEDNKNLDTKIAKILYSSLQLGFNSSASIKSSIKEAYELVGLTDKAKATDIIKWFNADEKTLRVDGKPTKGYILNSKKYIFG